MVKRVKEKSRTLYKLEDIYTINDNMKKLLYTVEKVASVNSSIMIYGETGTGKEMLVQAIHSASKRSNEAFVALNCAAIPENLLEAIFFGTTKGSYTGAEYKKGVLEEAHMGTLYLDELNSLPIDLQAKILRVIQDGSFRKIGELNERFVDIRIITSLNESPERLVAEGRLRRDLYYRLNVIRIDVPSLKERKDDIEMLVGYFIKSFNEEFSSSVEGIEYEALEILKYFDWPGNVRQLKNLLEAIFNFKKEGRINVEDLRFVDEGLFNKRKSLKEKIEDMEKGCINEALILANGNIKKTAAVLGIPRQTLQYKIKKYNIAIKINN